MMETESTPKEMTALEELRHSCAHVMAAAVLRLFPDTKTDIGPPTDNGFYYDFDLEHKFTPDDLKEIEAEMNKIVKENQRFGRKEVTREKATQYFLERNQPYKISRLSDIPEGAPITFYENGEFVDLCLGTHVNYTKKIKAFKLLSIAGAYHRGDENNKQMQRIYGTAFPSKDELEQYLQQLEKAKQRDHKKIGRDLQLFHIDNTVGSGLVLWAPRGAIVRKTLQEFISAELNKQGYEEVFTPHIAKLGLFQTSGHFPYYSDSQFPPLVDRDTIKKMAYDGKTVEELNCCIQDGSVHGYLLKPMNCPMHIKIFDSQPRSYRDLPVRLAEYGSVYRWEQSGELNGMTRVRGFTQDDAHIFCTEDQVGQELHGCLHLVKTIFETLGMKYYCVRVGLRNPDSSKYTGRPEVWDKAEQALIEVAKTLDMPFTQEPGEAAFYGPKIDFVVKDVIGREWQLGTVQVDYNLPERFNLRYTGSDNQNHQPVMIHRAPFGSMERFGGMLIEHFGGNFPTWLAPEQIRVLTIKDELISYGEKVLEKLKAKGIRCSIDRHHDKLGAKIRRAETMKIPHMAVLGAKEHETQTVSVRSRINKGLEGKFSINEFVAKLAQNIEERILPDNFS